MAVCAKIMSPATYELVFDSPPTKELPKQWYLAGELFEAVNNIRASMNLPGLTTKDVARTYADFDPCSGGKWFVSISQRGGMCTLNHCEYTPGCDWFTGYVVENHYIPVVIGSALLDAVRHQSKPKPQANGS